MRVVVTGASSGIGRSLALAWARRGAHLVLSARDADALALVARAVEAAGGRATVCDGDLTRGHDRERLISRALDGGDVDVLVNNAGRGYYALFRDVDVAELEGLFALNVVAPLHLTQLALPSLRKTGGTVVMMSSVAGVASSPKLGAYAATKFALEALCVALRAEEPEVRVVVVRPGPVDTPFRDNAFTRKTMAGVRPKAARVQTPEQVAELTLRAVDAGDPVVETTAFVRVASLASRVAPAVFRRVARRMARSS